MPDNKRLSSKENDALNFHEKTPHVGESVQRFQTAVAKDQSPPARAMMLAGTNRRDGPVKL